MPFLLLLLWLGLRNRPDPVWLEAQHLLRGPCTLISEVPDSLQQLYCRLQGTPYRAGDSTAFRLASHPYMSNIEWEAFQKLCLTISKAPKGRIVVTGVTGVGATKQATRAANLIAGRLDRVLEIACAPQFDLEYHKKYIGYEQDGQFMPGELLAFWDDCRQRPAEKFVVLLDNFDKINPETFFGPELWEAMSSGKDTAVLGGKKILPPDNCYTISVTHLGPGAYIELSEEHFKRLGQPEILPPNACELIAHLRQQARKKPGNAEEAALATALQDTAQMRNYIYYFLKSNELVRKRYAEGYQLGQGSNLRALYGDRHRAEFKKTYLNHINNLKPDRPLRESDFDALDYTIATKGLEPHTNFVSRQIAYLQETGYLVEITMVITTALLTFFGGLWVFRRREQIIRRYGERTREVFAEFEQQVITADVAARRLEEIKGEVDHLVMRRQLNYTEGLYFLAFIEDKVKRIEFARNVSQNFLELFNAFMEDDVLTENEYQKLRQFLETIRHKIPLEIYEQFSDKVEQTYLLSSGGSGGR